MSVEVYQQHLRCMTDQEVANAFANLETEFIPPTNQSMRPQFPSQYHEAVFEENLLRQQQADTRREHARFAALQETHAHMLREMTASAQREVERLHYIAQQELNRVHEARLEAERLLAAARRPPPPSPTPSNRSAPGTDENIPLAVAQRRRSQEVFNTPGFARDLYDHSRARYIQDWEDRWNERFSRLETIVVQRQADGDDEGTLTDQAGTNTSHAAPQDLFPSEAAQPQPHDAVVLQPQTTATDAAPVNNPTTQPVVSRPRVVEPPLPPIGTPSAVVRSLNSFLPFEGRNSQDRSNEPQQASATPAPPTPVSTITPTDNNVEGGNRNVVNPTTIPINTSTMGNLEMNFTIEGVRDWVNNLSTRNLSHQWILYMSNALKQKLRGYAREALVRDTNLQKTIGRDDYHAYATWSLFQISEMLISYAYLAKWDTSVTSIPSNATPVDKFYTSTKAVLMNQNFTVQDKQHVENFKDQILAVHYEQGDALANMDPADRKKCLMEMVYRICRKPYDNSIQHPLRQMALYVADRIDRGLVFDLLTFHDAVTDYYIFNALPQIEVIQQNGLVGGSSGKLPILPLKADARPIIYTDIPLITGGRQESGPTTKTTFKQQSTTSSTVAATTASTNKSNARGNNQKNKRDRSPPKNNSTSSNPSKKPKSTTNSSDAAIVPTRSTGIFMNGEEKEHGLWLCYICGHTHHRDKCYMMDHPDANTENKPFPQSQKGKAWQELHHRFKLDPTKTLDGKPIRIPAWEQFLAARKERLQQQKAQGNNISDIIPTENLTLPSYVFIHRNEEVKANTLIDTGASGNLISARLATILQQQAGIQVYTNDCSISMHSALVDKDGASIANIESTHHLFCNVMFKNVIPTPIQKIFYHKKLLNIQFSIVPGLHGIDLIIGLKTIRDYDLTQVLRAHFAPQPHSTVSNVDLPRKCLQTFAALYTTVQSEVPLGGDIPRCQPEPLGPCTCHDCLGNGKFQNTLEGMTHCVSHSLTSEDAQKLGTCSEMGSTVQVVAATVGEIKTLHELLDVDPRDPEDDPFESVRDIADMFPPEPSSPSSSTIPPQPGEDPLPKMMGDTPFHHRIRALCAEFVDIFSREVKPTPAKVAPLELHLKPNAKFLKTIGGGPRIQSPAKSAEIKRQLEQMLRLGVIQPSTSLTYSQVTLAPKPHSDKWRFCVDYRELNEDLESLYYVIPNIRSMMQRIGSKKPKKMGTVDCTSGYHQTSLSERSRQYAAFVTEFGVFEPVRVPFGIHVAPSYFQKTMATTVIGGELLFNNVDLYIDDILLYAQDDDEFLDILRKLFVRCRQFNITLHPDKCKLGVEEIEYVGHVIDKDGMHMSEEKIRKVLEFEKPSTVREMQSFLGLANYFRDHIRNHSTIAQPLYGMYNSKSDKGGKRLIWDDITTKAYNNLKKSIENCPKLYFLEDKTRSTEIFVETDASDYGIGAYLYQQRIGETVQRPVAFISKALSTTERR